MKKLFKTLVTLALCATLGVTATSLASCKDDPYTITVGASPTPHADILKDAVAKELEKDGYKLNVIEYSDYVQPNLALEAGDLDANYFQHNIYLKGFNDDHHTHLTAVANVHYEAFGIYRGSYTEGALTDILENSKVLVPNDPTNEARALFLLQDAGLITLNANATYNGATKNDIANNPKNLKIEEIEAAQIPLSLPDAAIGVVNGNYALQNNLGTAVRYENIPASEQEQYVNVIAVKAGNEESEKTKALKKAILSEAVKTYVQQKYNGSVVCVF
ncbi:MAG: metal ABC transporter substrate-binding protein [Clostridia bacterium]|nr:metal ABC transporter substrate-binding protein [Clostridia bacterium]